MFTVAILEPLKTASILKKTENLTSKPKLLSDYWRYLGVQNGNVMVEIYSM
jgi:hypothetical protein